MDIRQSLRRTFDPKYTHYACDGGGRDTYIISTNGGLMNQKLKNAPLKETYGCTAAYSSPAPRSDSWGLTYHSDGSGRDHYITHNSGGLYSRFSPAGNIKYFKDSLRQPIRRQSNDLFTKTTQRWIDFKGRKTITRNQEIVGNVVKRLSSPSPEPKKTRESMRRSF